MNIETCKVGPILTNCYIVEDEGEVLVIDPGDSLTQIVADIHGRPVKAIVVTHDHWDHVGALSGLASVTGAPVAMSRIDAPFVDGVSTHRDIDFDRGYGAPHVDRLLSEGDEVLVGSASFKVIETPGHTEGSICLYDPKNGVLFSGDTLFAGGRFGRTDLKGGSMEQMVQTLSTKFVGIPDDVIVYPGHEGASTMGRERARAQFVSALEMRTRFAFCPFGNFLLARWHVSSIISICAYSSVAQRQSPRLLTELL